MSTKRGNALVWAALIIAIIALILAWAAYNRTGADLEERIETQVEEAVADLDVNFDQVDEEVADEIDDVDEEETATTSAQ